MKRFSNFAFLLLLNYFPSCLAIGDIFATGQSCTVTTMIPGTMAPFIKSMEGTCYSVLACRALGGMAIGRCSGVNVCCVFPRSCETKSSQNQTYFTNPGYPSPLNGSNSCALTINKISSIFKICQLRLQFIDFELSRPNNGNCDQDRIVISGQNSNSVIPTLCGLNSGEHMYIDIDEVQTPITIRVITNGAGFRRWNIKISQIECINPSKAPKNCLQYYVGPTGSFSSFNYERALIGEGGESISGSGSTEAAYINNLDYVICFRKESGFCTQTFFVNSTTTPFEIVNTYISGTQYQQNYALAGATKCPNDYILLNAVRFCGSRLNYAGLNSNSIDIDAPVTDTTNGPFLARFSSDSNSNGRGFRINFQQNPCGAHVAENIITSTPVG